MKTIMAVYQPTTMGRENNFLEFHLERLKVRCLGAPHSSIQSRHWKIMATRYSNNSEVNFLRRDGGHQNLTWLFFKQSWRLTHSQPWGTAITFLNFIRTASNQEFHFKWLERLKFCLGLMFILISKDLGLTKPCWQVNVRIDIAPLICRRACGACAPAT